MLHIFVRFSQLPQDGEDEQVGHLFQEEEQEAPFQRPVTHQTAYHECTTFEGTPTEVRRPKHPCPQRRRSSGMSSTY